MGVRLAISFIILISTAYCADFTTYVGGATPTPYYQSTVGALATDAQGDTYVTGSGSFVNAFVTKLDPTGGIVFTITFGGDYTFSYGNSIAVDPLGNIWVGGQTEASNFPLVNALQSSVVSFGTTGFLVKMAPDGTVLCSSYFGGTLGASAINGVATDPSGNVYVTGFTQASDFPTTPGLPASQVNGGFSTPVYGLFAAKLDSTGQKILYSTVIAGAACSFCFAGDPKTVGYGIAVDGSGNALVAGISNTALPGIATGISPGAFVFKINAAGNMLVYFTYVGVAENDTNSIPTITFGPRPVAMDASGNAYVTGYTYGPDFPATPGAYRTTYDAGHNPEAFAMKLSPVGTTVWATLLGGQGNFNTTAAAISLDSADNVWLTGENAQSANFVAQLSADGSALPYLAEFPPAEAGQDIAVDQSGVVYFAGPIGLISTITPTQPLTPRVLSIANAGSGQLSGLIAPGEIISLFGTGLGPAIPVAASPLNGLFPTSLGGVQVLVDDMPIPLLYVSASQINAEIPAPINRLKNGLADVRVLNNSTTLPDFRLLATTSVPGRQANVKELRSSMLTRRAGHFRKPVDRPVRCRSRRAPLRLSVESRPDRCLHTTQNLALSGESCPG